ncbi:exopolysaccharide biosynthesis protein [Marinovum sp.]|uniref:exopolysaccharide biosynthesis protein n=1 Tax=Marinovum sp. TaxID=2024839 RepID=UPI003A9078E2
MKAPDPLLDKCPIHTDGFRIPRRLSDILQEIADAPATPEERMSLGHLIDGFGNRAYGALLFIFAIPVALPIAIPGISAVLGAPLLFLSWQLMRGREEPWLPEVMRRRSFRHGDFSKTISRGLPWMRRVERLVGPRLTWLVRGRRERAIGCLVFILALILFLPIPFGNSIPGLAIAILPLAILERDGAAAIAGTFLGLVGIGAVSGIIFGMIKAAVFLLQSAIGS